MLAEHTKIPILQAEDAAVIERDHIYVIPAGSYLSIKDSALHLSKPNAPHGARMPVDFLFESMAKDCGNRAVAIILSGTGTDGTLGVKAIRGTGGYIIAQDPIEAE